MHCCEMSYDYCILCPVQLWLQLPQWPAFQKNSFASRSRTYAVCAGSTSVLCSAGEPATLCRPRRRSYSCALWSLATSDSSIRPGLIGSSAAEASYAVRRTGSPPPGMCAPCSSRKLRSQHCAAKPSSSAPESRTSKPDQASKISPCPPNGNSGPADPLGLSRPSFLTDRVQPVRRPLLRLKKL